MACSELRMRSFIHLMDSKRRSISTSRERSPIAIGKRCECQPAGDDAADHAQGSLVVQPVVVNQPLHGHRDGKHGDGAEHRQEPNPDVGRDLA